MNIVGTLNALALQPFVVPFLETPLENATDITTLDFTGYTDFINHKREWTANWFMLLEDDYNDLKAIWASQFNGGGYPTFSIPYYDIEVPVRMKINDKDIRKDGCQIYNVTITLTEQFAVGSTPSYLMIGPNAKLLINSSGYLTL